MATDQKQRDTGVKWVKFKDNCGVLRRVVRADGERALLIQFTGRGDGEGLRRRALKFGFSDAGGNGSLKLRIPGGIADFTAVQLANELGGTVFYVERERLFRYPWTLDFALPNLGRSLSTGEPGHAALEIIGKNHLGEDVFRDALGKRFRKITLDEGGSSYQVETATGHLTEFLRAGSLLDLAAISAGLFRMVEAGSIQRNDLDRVVKAACEPGGGHEPIDPDEAAHLVTEGLVKQIVDGSIEDDGSRRNFHRAMRLADNASHAVDIEPDARQGLWPTTGLLIFLKRLIREAKEIEFSGSSRLAISTPVLCAERPATFQMYDLTETNPDQLSERAANVLASRKSDGVSVLFAAGSAQCDTVLALRFGIGLAYSFEIVAEIASQVATGRHGEPVTVFVVGERRPGVSESLPLAARRTFEVVAWSDLDALYREILRSRIRIRDWHLGIEEEESRAREDREENERQRPYVPLSRATNPFTMIPKALEGATAKALRRAARDFRDKGGVDGAVSGSLGLTVSELAGILTAEQVDAVALREVSQRQNRAFLLADQTGVGKGRSLAAIARLRLRTGGKVMYLTENAEINIPDVWRDLLAVGAQQEARPVLLAARPVSLSANSHGTNGSGGNGGGEIYRTEPAASRRAIYESRAWPPGYNLIISNYSQFSGREESPNRVWAETALDESTLLILDESHNAINPRSNTGQAIRSMIDSVGRSNVVFATATPMRNPSGADLYRPLLPDAEGGRLDGILSGLASGGETAQESFTTMLAEDGVFLRRDHDLSNIEFHVRLPNDARMQHYQEVMNRFSPMVELLLDASLQIGALVGRAQAVRYQQLVNEGHDARVARAQTNALYQYSGAAGGPLARLARVTINALKVDQVVEEALDEIRQGRKPLITFHSTSAALFSELAGDLSDGSGSESLSLADQIRRISESIYLVRMDDELHDARQLDERVANLAERIEAAIGELPEDLPVSPVDAVIEGLLEQGVSAGEISGRSLAYRSGAIVRRDNKNRRQTVNAFNDGDLDVLIYNMAGATGGSYHASPEFRDQRPRSLIEMETPIDIIKYIQSQGRGNRYGQVAKPRVVSVMTGLIPEMRILQQRNRKLRTMGASIDGNRSHPLLLDDVPDFLNVVGDQATAQVLLARPDTARRLGFLELAAGYGSADQSGVAGRGASPESGVSRHLLESIANRALTRSLVLSAAEQSTLVDLIRIEFEAIVEELESRNSNPLKPREIPGEIEILGTTLYSGIESTESDLDTSTFFAPLYISTGIHHFSEEPIHGDELVRLVNQSKVTDGAEGFSPCADRLETMIPGLLGELVHAGTSLEDAMRNPEGQSYRFRQMHARLMRLMHLLANIRPGRVIHTDEFDGLRDHRLRTIVKVSAPDPRYTNLPQAYKIRTVSPGSSRPELISLDRLVRYPSERVRFRTGLEHGVNETHLRDFWEQCNYERRFPVQVLSGNHLTAISEARQHSLGTMSLYRDLSGSVHRGIVVNQAKVDLRFLPVQIPSARVATGLAAMVVNGEIDRKLAIWSGPREAPTLRITVERKRVGSLIFRVSRPHSSRRSELKKFNPRLKEVLGRLGRATEFWSSYTPNPGFFQDLFAALEGVELQTDGMFRQQVNEINEILERGEYPARLQLI